MHGGTMGFLAVTNQPRPTPGWLQDPFFRERELEKGVYCTVEACTAQEGEKLSTRT